VTASCIVRDQTARSCRRPLQLPGAPFSGRVAFSAPSAEAGWLVLSGDGGSDGGIVDATAVRIRFAAP
jgi:hypothetical protein